MSDWLEIDKQIAQKNGEPICFFEDDFQLSSKIKQIEHLPDTKEYLRGLERKLERLKGSSKTSTERSKDIIQSLIGIRQDTMSSFLTADEEPADNLSEIDDGDLKDSSALVSDAGGYRSNLDKKMHPERQALTREEQQLLIKSDFLALRTERAEQQQDTEQKTALGTETGVEQGT